METLAFKLGEFEGPLELLLFLISKHKMKITDIEIGKLLEQYLAYMDKMKDADLEISSAFLEMAARLVYIKTVFLLPKHEEAVALKKELEGELIEYERVRRAAAPLSERYSGAPAFVREPAPVKTDPVFRGELDPKKLLNAYLLAIGKAGRRLPPSKEAFKDIVNRRFVSVSSRIVWLLRRLYKNGEASYAELFPPGERSELVATFLAVLELMKAGRVTLNEAGDMLYFNRRSAGERRETR